jgi:phosphatidylglycerophosphate synthase
MSALIKEYKASLKYIEIEDNTDLILFRPLAFVLVKVLKHTAITPNQLSVLSIVFGVVTGVCFSLGSVRGYFWGGIFAVITHTLDCSDGMIARLKKNGTVVGRIVDGVADYCNGISFYLGFALGVSKTGYVFSYDFRILIALSVICRIVQAMMVDKNKNDFLVHFHGLQKSTAAELELFGREFNRLKQLNSRKIDQFLIKLYLGYLHLQKPSAEIKPVTVHSISDKKKYTILLRLWSFLAPSFHVFIILLSGLFYFPSLYFYYSIGFGCLWLILLSLGQWFWLVKRQAKP